MRLFGLGRMRILTDGATHKRLLTRPDPVTKTSWPVASKVRPLRDYHASERIMGFERSPINYSCHPLSVQVQV